MPSFTHEILVELVRNRGDVVRELLRACAGVTLDGVTAEVASADLSQAVSVEYRADCTMIFRDSTGVAVLAAVVEVQLQADPGKRRTWPMYVAAARARFDCAAMLLVIAPELGVARWARQPIELGHPGFRLQPLVVAYEDVPRIEDAAIARRLPELAVLSALAHRTQEVAMAALVGARSLLDEDLSRLYFDVVMLAVPDAVRSFLEAQMLRYEYRSDFARKYVQQGREEGRVEGRVEALGHLRAAALELVRLKLGSLASEDEAKVRALVGAQELTALIIALGAAARREDVRAALDAPLAR